MSAYVDFFILAFSLTGLFDYEASQICIWSSRAVKTLVFEMQNRVFKAYLQKFLLIYYRRNTCSIQIRVCLKCFSYFCVCSILRGQKRVLDLLDLRL